MMDELPGVIRTVKGLALAALLLAAVFFGAGFGMAYWWQVLPARAEAVALRAEVVDLQAEITDLEADLEACFDGAETDVANLTAQLDDALMESSELGTEVGTLAVEVDVLQADLVACQDSARTEADDLRAKLAEARAQAAALKDRAEASAGRVAELQGELDTCQADIETANDKAVDLSLGMASLRTELETCQAEAVLESKSQFDRGVFMLCQWIAVSVGSPMDCMSFVEFTQEEGWYQIPTPGWPLPEPTLPESPAPSRGGA